MSIRYDLFPSPPQPGKENEPGLYVRPVVYRTVSSEEMAQNISDFTSFSVPSVCGVLSALGTEIARCLSRSENIKLEGIGTFSLSLEGPIVKSPKEVRSEYVKVKKILFRADPALKKSVKRASIQRVESRNKSSRYTENQRKNRIRWYINGYGSIYKTMARGLNNCSNDTATKDLQDFLAAGEIKAVRIGRYTVYVKL